MVLDGNAMEQITVTCPKCLASYRVSESHLGKSARCRRCETTFVISRPVESVTVPYPITAMPTRTKDAGQPPEGDASGKSGKWNVGDIILGVYEVKPLQGPTARGKHFFEGGMGVVYRVRHLGWDLDLAVKSPKPEAFQTERGKLNFERECKTWIDLGLHPNIVSCYYVRHLDGIPLVFAEFVDGGTLQDWVGDRRLYQGGTELALARILDIAVQFAWGLEYAHARGLVHQDVKPGNVMMRGGVPKVTDFGLAKALSAMEEAPAATARERTLVTWGGMTPGYCSPEQVEAAMQTEARLPAAQRTKLTPQTDVWSWAVSVLEMFYGGPPCPRGGQTAGSVLQAYRKNRPDDPSLPHMPDELAALLRRCFKRNPGERPRNMAEIVDELREIYHHVTGKPYPRQQPATAAIRADGLNNRAASLLDLGKHEEATRLLEDAWQQYPWQPELTYNRALLAWRAGRTADTDLIAHLKKLCATRPKQWEAAYSLGLTQLEMGDVQPAIEAFEQAVSLGGGGEVKASLQRAEGLLPSAPRCVRSFTGRSERLTDVYLSADQRWALAAVEGASPRVWETITGQPLLSFGTLQPRPGATALSGDGRWELVANRDKTLDLRNAASGQQATLFTQIAWGPSTSVPLPGGDETLWACADYTLALCETQTGNLIRSFSGHTAAIHSISTSADGRWALSGSSDQTLRFWEMKTGRCLRTFRGHAGAVTSVFLAADARWAFSVSTDNTLRVWNLELLSSPAKRFVATVLLCHVTTAEEASRAQARFEDLFEMAHDLAAKGQIREALELARAAREQTGFDAANESLTLWNELGRHCVKTDLRDAWCVQTFEGHDVDVQSGVLSHDARHALSAGGDGSLRLWDTSTGKPLQTLLGHTDSVRSVSLSRDGRWALSGSWDKTVRLWDVLTGECCRVFEGHSSHVTSVALSADSRWALSGSWDRSLRLWQVATGRCVRSFADHTAYVNSVVLSADNRWAVSGSEDKTVRLWDTAGGRCLRTFEGHTEWVHAVAMTPDARHVLSGGKDRALRLWDVAGGRCLKELAGHTNLVTSVAISADGRWALSGSKDRTMRLWDLHSAQCRHVFRSHTGPVSSVALSPDGRWALSGSEDGLLNLWELDWAYEFPGWAAWDEKARHCLDTFLTNHTPYAEGDIARAGRIHWNDQDFQQLLVDLQHAGFGWLEAEGVRAELQRAAASQSPLPPGEG